MDTMYVDPIVAEEEFRDEVRRDVGCDVCLHVFDLDFQFDLSDDVEWGCVRRRALSCFVDEFLVMKGFQKILMNDGDGGACVDNCIGWLVVNLHLDVDWTRRH